MPGTPQAQLQKAIARKIANLVQRRRATQEVRGEQHPFECGDGERHACHDRGHLERAELKKAHRGQDDGDDQRAEIRDDVHDAREEPPHGGLLDAKPPECEPRGDRHTGRGERLDPDEAFDLRRDGVQDLHRHTFSAELVHPLHELAFERVGFVQQEEGEEHDGDGLADEAERAHTAGPQPVRRTPRLLYFHSHDPGSVRGGCAGFRHSRVQSFGGGLHLLQRGIASYGALTPKRRTQLSGACRDLGHDRLDLRPQDDASRAQRSGESEHHGERRKHPWDAPSFQAVDDGVERVEEQYGQHHR
jgi:hypothetical protein